LSVSFATVMTIKKYIRICQSHFVHLYCLSDYSYVYVFQQIWGF
jgi:hypothetical protein